MYKIYIVEFGDTVGKIAEKFDVSVDVLEKINGPINNLVPGMQIVVPNNSANLPFSNYVVEKGDNVYDIARKNNVNYQDLLMINGLDENDYIYPGQQILIPKPGYGIYITEGNETINGVAGRIGIQPNEIISQNGSLYLMPNQLIIYKKEKSS